MKYRVEQRLSALVTKFQRDANISDLSFGVFFETDSFSFSGLGAGATQPHFIASTTKTFASVALQTLLKTHGLRLEQRALEILGREVLEGLNTYRGQDRAKEITIGSLLAQTSGIPDYFSKKRLPKGAAFTPASREDPGWSFSQALDIARGMDASFDPNSGVAEYSSTNYQLVGRMIEILSGKPLRAAMNDLIFSPLALRDTDLLTFDNLELFDACAPLIFGQRPYLGARRMASLGAEGAIVSTSSDVLRFSRALSDGALISPSEVQAMRTPNLPIKPFVRYGLGLMQTKIPLLNIRGFVGYGHLGATGHFMLYFPEVRMHIAGTINQLKGGAKMLQLISQIVKKTG